MEAVSFFKCFCSCFSGDGSLREDARLSVGEGLKTFGKMKIMFGSRSVNSGVKKELKK